MTEKDQKTLLRRLPLIGASHWKTEEKNIPARGDKNKDPWIGTSWGG